MSSSLIMLMLIFRCKKRNKVLLPSVFILKKINTESWVFLSVLKQLFSFVYIFFIKFFAVKKNNFVPQNWIIIIF